MGAYHIACRPPYWPEIMTVDESFNELYKLLRGSRCAALLLQARTHFDANDANQSLIDVQKTRQTYIESRKTLLEAEENEELSNGRDSQFLKKRQNKAVDAVEHFDELLSLLTIQSKKAKLITPVATHLPVKPTTSTLETNAAAQHQNADDILRKALNSVTSAEDVRKCIGQFCDLKTIEADHDFESGERMVIFSNGMGHVVEVDDPALLDGTIRIVTWLDQKRMLPIGLDKFLKSALKGRVLQLVVRDQIAPEPLVTNNNIRNTDVVEHEKLVSETAERDKILDMGAFTQLLDAAQRSGIVPGSNIIIQVRDCEYRLGKYNKALQMMETLYTTFLGAESQRNQRLKREEMEIASGRKKMSPRELQLKRSQDNQATQAVDRAKVRFQRVLEGLRGLLYLERTSTTQD